MIYSAVSGVKGQALDVDARSRTEVELAVEALLAFQPDDNRCLSFDAKDELICYIQRQAPQGWVYARLDNREGLIPISYARARRLLLPSSSAMLAAIPAQSPGVLPQKTEAPTTTRWLPEGGSIRSRTWAFLDDPSASRGAFVWSIFIMGLIGASVLLIVIQTMTVFWEGDQLRNSFWWDVSEVVVTLIFSVEYGLRLWAFEKKRWEFVLAPMNVIDAAAISPFYIELIADLSGSGQIESSWLRVLRLLRLARVLKLGKYSEGLRMFANTMISSANALIAQVMLMAIFAVFVASLAYFAEQGTWDADQKQWLTEAGDPSPFISIPGTLWWAVVTMTTVGYGDVTPITVVGRVVAFIAMCTGVLSIAMPVTVIASNFQEHYFVKKTLPPGAKYTNPELIIIEFRTHFTQLRSLLLELRVNLSRIHKLSESASVRVRTALHRQRVLGRTAAKLIALPRERRLPPPETKSVPSLQGYSALANPERLNKLAMEVSHTSGTGLGTGAVKVVRRKARPAGLHPTDDLLAPSSAHA